MVTLGTNFQLEQCLFLKMFMVGGVIMIGICFKMDGKAEMAETQITVQDIEKIRATCSRKIEGDVLIGTYLKG